MKSTTVEKTTHVMSIRELMNYVTSCDRILIDEGVDWSFKFDHGTHEIALETRKTTSEEDFV